MERGGGVKSTTAGVPDAAVAALQDGPKMSCCEWRKPFGSFKLEIVGT